MSAPDIDHYVGRVPEFLLVLKSVDTARMPPICDALVGRSIRDEFSRVLKRILHRLATRRKCVPQQEAVSAPAVTVHEVRNVACVHSPSVPSPTLADGQTLPLAISQASRGNAFTDDGAVWMDGFLRELVALCVSTSRTIASQEKAKSVESSIVRAAINEAVWENTGDSLAKYMVDKASTQKYDGPSDGYLNRLCTSALVHMPGLPFLNGADIVLRRAIGYVFNEVTCLAQEIADMENRTSLTRDDCIWSIRQDRELRELAKKLPGVSLQPTISPASQMYVNTGGSELRKIGLDSRRSFDSLDEKNAKVAEEWFQHHVASKNASPKRSHDEAFGSEDVDCLEQEWVERRNTLCLDHKWCTIVATREMMEHVYNGLPFQPEALIELQRIIEAHLGELLRKSVELYHHRQGAPRADNEEDNRSWKSLLVRDFEAAKKQMKRW